MNDQDFEKIWAYFTDNGDGEYVDQNNKHYVWMPLGRVFKDELKKKLMEVE
jgi:hypothetical protein